MRPQPTGILGKALAIFAIAIIAKTIATVALNLPDYIPPNFSADFLRGREAHFYGWYQVAFVAHILSGPCSLIAGVLLTLAPLRQRFPAFHRLLGKLQVGCVLLLVVPSGLWMARYADAGPIAGVAFACLSLATGFTVAMGWRQIVRRRIAAHNLWMNRCLVLLCSAVVLRVYGGLSAALGIYVDWLDPLAAWGCWLVPLAIFEIWRVLNRSFHKNHLPPRDVSR